jgi:hypothetical protein
MYAKFVFNRDRLFQVYGAGKISATVASFVGDLKFTLSLPTNEFRVYGTEEELETQFSDNPEVRNFYLVGYFEEIV